MADNVVDINIKANIDTSDIQKEMSKIATNTSQKAADVLGKFMDNITKSVNDVNSTMSKLDSFKNMDIFSKASDMVESLKDTKGLDTTNTKLLTLEKSLMHVSKEILKLQDGFDHVYATAQKRIDLESKFGDLSGLEQKIETLKSETDDLKKTISDTTGKSLPGANAMGIMDTWQSAIEKSRSALQSLQSTREKILAKDEGTEEWRKDLEEVNQAIASVTSNLGNASKAFYKFGRSNNFGQTKQDIVEAYQQLSVYYDKMRELRALMDARSEVYSAKQSAAGHDIIRQFSGLVNTFNQLEQEVNQINNGLDQAGSNAQRLNSAANKAGASMSQIRNTVWAASRLLGNFYTLGLDIVRTAKTIANIYNRIWGIFTKIVGIIKKMRDNIKKTSDEHSKSWKQMLRDVIRYSLGIRSLFMLFRRLRGYIKEAFQAMAEQIPEVNATLSELKSSFNMLKGSLATALEPVIQAISAALLRLINIISTLLTYIGMFFAAISGRGYVYKANKSMTSFADAAGGAAKNVKELNKQLQGFDELNNLTTNDNKGGGGGANSPLANFEKVDIPDWIKKLADLAKKIAAAMFAPIKAAWDKVKDYVINSWKRAAVEIAKLFLDVIRDFLRAWAKYGEPIFVKIFQIVGDIGMIVGNIASALREAWNEADNGYKIWSAILHIIYYIVAGIRMITEDMVEWTSTINLTPAMTAFREWLESLVPVAETVMEVFYDIWHDAIKPMLDWTFNGENSGIVQLFNIFRDFNKKINWNRLRKNLDRIWKAVGRFGKKIGQGLLDFINGLADRLADWVNSDDFIETCNAIVKFLDDVEVKDIKDDLDQILRIVKNLASAIWDAIKFVLDHKDQILDALEWASKHIKGLIATFVLFKSIIDIARLGANIFLFVTALQKALGVAGAIGTTLEATTVGAAATSAVKAGISFATTFASEAVAGLQGLGTVLMAPFEGAITTMLAPIPKLAAMSGAQFATIFVSVLAAAIIGFQVGKQIGKWLFPNDAEIYDNFKWFQGPDSFFNTILGCTPDELHDAWVMMWREIWTDAFGDMAAVLNKTNEAIEKAKNGEYIDVEEFRREIDEVSIGAGIVEEKMQEVNTAFANANPQLQQLSQNMQEAMIPGWDMINVLQEIGYGLDNFQTNGKNSAETLDYIKSGLGNVSQDTRDFYRELEAGNPTYEAVIAHMRDYKVATEELPTIKDIDDKFDQSMANNLDRLPSTVADKMRQAGDEGKAAIDASSEEVRLATEEALTAITDFENDLDAVDIDWNAILGNLDEIDLSAYSTELATFGDNVVNAMPSSEDWSNKGVDIPNSLVSGITSNSSTATTAMSELGTDMISEFNNSIVANQDSTITTIDNYTTAVTNSFITMRNNIVEVFNGLASDLSTILSNIASAVATTFNDISTSISSMKEGMNSFTGSMNTNYHVNIPRLAKGAVIPPNNEFLAVLGDQKSGTNIESPLSTMVEAFNMANKGGNEQELALLQEQNDLLRQLLQKEFGISENAIFNSVRKQNSIYTKSNGVSAFA